MQGPQGVRGKVVVAHPDRKAQRALARLCGATLCPVEVVADVDGLIAALGPTVVAVVDSSLALSRPELCRLPARAWIAVPGEGLAPAEAAMVGALVGAGWRHVLAHPMPILAEELLTTIQKVLRDDVFGLRKYMAWGAEVRRYVLEDTTSREAAVAALARDVVAAGLPDRISSLVSVVADELLANAIYVGPIDRHGLRYRASEARDIPRALRGQDAVTLGWATDARYLAIEVRDRHGSIDLGVVAERLAVAGLEPGGAPAPGAASDAAPGEGGMGLPLAYACCNQFIVNVAPGAVTEIVTLIDVRYKPTELARAGSFHGFVGAAPAEEPS